MGKMLLASTISLDACITTGLLLLERRVYPCGMALRLCAALLVCVAVLSPSSAWTQTRDGREAFPLAKGSYWVYEGTSEEQRPGQGMKVFKENIRQRMEVVDRIDRGRIVASVVRGYPTEEPDELYVLVVVEGLQFYLLPAEKSILKRLRDKEDELIGLVK